MKAPAGIDDKALVLMADIFPTGFFGASNALKNMTKEQISNAVVVVIGCGPVGLCAIIAARSFAPKHVFAVDSVDSRLQLAKSLGAEPLNFMTDKEGMEKRIKKMTEGRGADAVIEVVGLSPALKTGFDLLRPWGTLSSIGVHNAEVWFHLQLSGLQLTLRKIPWSGNQAYGKNLTVQMGRCPVRSIFPQALALLQEKQHLLT